MDTDEEAGTRMDGMDRMMRISNGGWGGMAREEKGQDGWGSFNREWTRMERLVEEGLGWMDDGDFDCGWRG
jgi:hypothetical protein